jgi:DNA-binding protein HU-beta
MTEKKKAPAKKAVAKKTAPAKKAAPVKKAEPAKKAVAKKTAAKREITQSPSGLTPMTGAVTPEGSSALGNAIATGKITISTTPTPKAAPAKKKSFFARLFRR